MNNNIIAKDIRQGNLYLLKSSIVFNNSIDIIDVKTNIDLDKSVYNICFNSYINETPPRIIFFELFPSSMYGPMITTSFKNTKCYFLLVNNSWKESIVHCSLIINCLLCKANKYKNLQDIWYNKKPNISYFKIFGYKFFSHMPKVKNAILDSKNSECILVSYCDVVKAYRLYTIERKRLVEMRDAFIIENKIFIKTLKRFRMNNDIVCNLHKDSYELIQASNTWQERIHSFILKESIVRVELNHNKYEHNDSPIKIVVYVDDLIIICTNFDVLLDFKHRLNLDFS